MGWWARFLGKEAGETAMKMAPTGMKEHTEEMKKMARDPVCGMEVDEKTAAGKSEHMGKTYYFCAPGCKSTFDADPAKYTEGGGHEMAEHSGHQM